MPPAGQRKKVVEWVDRHSKKSDKDYFARASRVQTLGLAVHGTQLEWKSRLRLRPAEAPTAVCTLFIASPAASAAVSSAAAPFGIEGPVAINGHQDRQSFGKRRTAAREKSGFVLTFPLALPLPLALALEG